jgi:hypothetical protein
MTRLTRRRQRGVGAFTPFDPRVSAADLTARLAERDARLASDTRSEAQRWLNEPPRDRSALAQGSAQTPVPRRSSSSKGWRVDLWRK